MLLMSRLASLESRRGWQVFLILLVLTIVLVPVLNLMLPPTSPFHVPTYMLSLLGKYLCFALLALSLDLIWGYAGALSLGHGAFFALGGYCMGMYLMRQIGTRGVYGNPDLPDFMVFLNWSELPWYWWGFDQFWFAALMIMAVPALLAYVLGWLAFRSRITGVYFSIITQAMVFALMLAFFRNEMGFGGNNGLTDFKEILGFNIQAQGTRIGLYVASALVLALGYLISRFIVTSKLGRVLMAIRDAESRVRFLGYSVTNAKLFVFTVSAILAGIAGALVRAAGRHHQPVGNVARQLDRDRGLGRGRRTRHAVRRDHRGLHGQRRQELLHRGGAGVLAVLPRRPLHRLHALPAPGHHRLRGPDAEPVRPESDTRNRGGRQCCEQAPRLRRPNWSCRPKPRRSGQPASPQAPSCTWTASRSASTASRR